ncbi:hypothetical protein FO519_004003 [Halicephalobus sp. NKZ332]|nr:hypothetical protein FO519_004003 [Halicephalobus sp. NKZ332]
MRLNFTAPLWILLLTVVFVETRIDGMKDKFEKLRMTPKTMEKVQNLHTNCYYTAVKAIMGKLGKDLYRKLPTQQKRILARCLDQIEDKKDLVEAAKCITVARKRFQAWEKKQNEAKMVMTTRAPQNWRAFLQKYDDFNRLHVDQNGHGITPVPENYSGKWWKTEEEEATEETTTAIPTTTSTVISTTTSAASNVPEISFKSRFENIPPKAKSSFKAQNPSTSGVPVNTKINSKVLGQPIPVKDTFIPARLLFHHKSKSPAEYSTDYSIEYKPLKEVKISLDQRKFRQSRFKSLSYDLAQKYPMYYQPKLLSYFPYHRRRDTSRRFEKLRHRVKRHMRFSDSKQHYYKKHVFTIKSQDYLKSINHKGGDYSGKIVNVIESFVGPDLKNETLKSRTWEKTYERLARVRKASDDQKRVPGAKVYEHRMYDIVLDREQPTLSPSERRSPAGIVHQAMNLLSNITTHNSIKDAHQVPGSRVLSPRFMPLTPADDGKQVQRTLSPDILSLYKDSNENGTLTFNKVGNVPNILKTLGLTEKDRNKIMQMVMDITGSSASIDEALKIYEYLGMFDKDVSGPILDATERIMASFSKLEDNLHLPQKFKYEKKGFSFIKKAQLQKLMRDQGVKDDEIDLADFDIYDKMTDEQMEESLWMTIENIANNITIQRPSQSGNSTRSKRELVIVLQPTILAPLLFTVQTGLSILVPLILAPYIFGPFILGPLILTPFVLTPYILSPNILNPYVITSLILSPVALSPDILSPMVISASVLSPTVLSPAVLTPTYLTGSVLSPTFLS